MNFNSIQFLIYFPIVAAVTFLIPFRFRWAFLLVASYYFYMSWNPALVFLILFTTAVSYAAGLWMEKTEDKKKRKLLMVTTLVACLGVLFFFKYFNFLSLSVTGILQAFRLPIEDFTLDLLLPVGISFYTFQTLSYVIDVYNGNIKAEHHFGYYALFVSFFPQLVAGPIERPENLLPQLHTEQHFTEDNFIAGMRHVLAGFVKKVVVADTLAPFVNAVYNDAAATANAPAIIIATFLFTFQVYCDFSGYTDIAVGCARIMGFRLMENFKMPFSSRSIHEFWERWHISLTSWFRDYIFYPMAMSKKLTRFSRKLAKKTGNRNLGIMLPQCFALFMTFLLSGLWHGAAWTFVLWGAMHGFYQVLERLTDKKRKAFWEKRGVSPDNKLFAFYQMVVTFLLCNFALISFRANSVQDLGLLMKNLFTNWSFAGTFATLGMQLADALIVIVAIVIMVFLDRLYIQHLPMRQPKGGLLAKFEVCGFLLMAIVCAWMALLAGDGAAAFIYFQF